ncbi:GNAT family N-acetyltransferase [Candidatus Dependentiae bacterium]|nr:GNAT family N-acetyltransferase [Candidatus Dependentiae bacterium]
MQRYTNLLFLFLLLIIKVKAMDEHLPFIKKCNFIEAQEKKSGSLMIKSSPSRQEHFTFKQVTLDDVPLLQKWFNEQHVSTWWPVPKENEDFFTDFLPRMRKENMPYIAILGNLPLGYIQLYPVDATETWLQSASLPSNTFGTDQFIAHSEYIGKGYGTRMLNDFICYLIAQDRSLSSFIVDPSPDNIGAIKSYEKVGFKSIGILEAPWGSALLMHLSLNY